MSEPKIPEKGPIEILCKEIGFAFDARLERPEILIAFVKVLVSNVGEMWSIDTMIADRLGDIPSHNSGDAISTVAEMLACDDRAVMLEMCADLHNNILDQPDDGPCNHYIDMLSSCVSAIRFGLENPCRSRHAAAAADHIWGHRYGVRLFDNCTPAWQHDWARQQLQAGILSLLPEGTKP